MTDSPPEQSADVGDPGREGPSDRIWELELLISGAVTLGLLQLPGRVDALYRSVDAPVSSWDSRAS